MQEEVLVDKEQQMTEKYDEHMEMTMEISTILNQTMRAMKLTRESVGVYVNLG